LPFFDSVARQFQQTSYGGYATLINAYVQTLAVKLQFHKQHPLFTGTFDYEEYIAQNGVTDPNEG
jgi:hypothetical protein